MGDYIQDIRNRYLKVVAASLDGSICEDPPLPASGAVAYDANLRAHGWDWPSRAFTMVGSKRLENVRRLLESVIGSDVPGDFVETGVWRGGASIMARAVLQAYCVTDRRVFACDSFEGLPRPNPDKFPVDEGSVFHNYVDLSVSLDAVRSNFAKFDLLDDQVVFVKGWFRDTMPTLPCKNVAVLRLDGDMYESTIDPLVHLYDRIPTGGWVIVDDYNVVPAAKQAVDDFLQSRSLDLRMEPIDGVGVCFRVP
ncbi:TylF/MycF/NovP-related O-methyltransferase [Aminobacter aganoensis]|uniref:Macrocin O-methyltransferase n=1 Tax=Aminobacter aganoensis TaxID=83264 RepID=A0A7X0F9B1_9HYPH|nr:MULTISPECIES: TylF/MycF/NovP-related O-methyltransferase [Aminobacter]MBB6355509.1 hypothetical protein [Aminobacter aganoensis]